MINLLYQEAFKLWHKKGIFYFLLILLIFMLANVLSTRTGDSQRYFIALAFDGFQWVDIGLIVFGANIISSEFEYGTMKRLVADHNNKFLIYSAKMIVLLGYDLFLHIFTFGLTIILKLLFYGSRHPFNQVYLNQKTLMDNLLVSVISNFYATFLIIAVVFMIASMSRTSSIAATIGFVFVAFGSGISGILIQVGGHTFPWIVWNPGNMFNVGNQLLLHYVEKNSLLTNNQLIWGNLVYFFLFLVIGYWAFSRKRI